MAHSWGRMVAWWLRQQEGALCSISRQECALPCLGSAPLSSDAIDQYPGVLRQCPVRGVALTPAAPASMAG
jgi:hypothetical protein